MAHAAGTFFNFSFYMNAGKFMLILGNFIFEFQQLHSRALTLPSLVNAHLNLFSNAPTHQCFLTLFDVPALRYFAHLFVDALSDAEKEEIRLENSSERLKTFTVKSFPTFF